MRVRPSGDHCGFMQNAIASEGCILQEITRLAVDVALGSG
jgi:hypothetical protein